MVPLGSADMVLADCHAKLAQEESALERLRQGVLLADQMEIPDPTLID